MCFLQFPIAILYNYNSAKILSLRFSYWGHFNAILLYNRSLFIIIVLHHY